MRGPVDPELGCNRVAGGVHIVLREWVSRREGRPVAALAREELGAQPAELDFIACSDIARVPLEALPFGVLNGRPEPGVGVLLDELLSQWIAKDGQAPVAFPEGFEAKLECVSGL